MKVLVVYYSLTGHTKKLAEEIAVQLDADIEQIEDVKARTGMWSRFAAAFQAVFKHSAPVEHSKHDLAKFDLIILGTPIWAWAISSPMRTYLTRHTRSLKKVAFFCTEGSAGGERAFKQMEALLGNQPIATLEVTALDQDNVSYKTKVERFIEAVSTDNRSA